MNTQFRLRHWVEETKKFILTQIEISIRKIWLIFSRIENRMDLNFLKEILIIWKWNFLQQQENDENLKCQMSQEVS